MKKNESQQAKSTEGEFVLSHNVRFRSVNKALILHLTFALVIRVVLEICRDPSAELRRRHHSKYKPY